MPLPTVNLDWIAIGLASLASNASGYLYYSKPLAGRWWSSVSQVSDEKRCPYKAFLLSFVAMGIIAAALSCINQGLHYEHIAEHLETAGMAWLGFVLPVLFGEYLWLKKPFALVMINAVYYLLAMIIMTVVIFYYTAHMVS